LEAGVQSNGGSEQISPTKTYSAEERFADAVVHIVGVSGGIIAVVGMMAAAIVSLPLAANASLAIYGVGVLAMFGCSAAYHLIPSQPWKDTLRRLDHAAIFLKIAGTYTPFALVKIGGVAGYTLFGGIWAVALAGLAGKLFARTSGNRIDVPIYLLLGWAGLLVFRPLADAVSLSVLALLGLGGVLYTAGVIFHLWRALKYQNAIWHAFVLVATCCHFGAVTTAMFS
jgi:hemolysin III